MTEKKSTPLQIEDAARLPLPGMAIPGGLAFSPDGRWISYLFSPGGSLVRQLFKYNPISGEHSLLAAPAGAAQGEDNLSPEERLRRERLRQYELGITSYAWSADGRRLLIPLPDGLYVQEDLAGGLERRVEASGGALLDPSFSPDGEWIAYVQNGELWIAPSSGGPPRRLTGGDLPDGKTRGLAEYIAQEEMDRRQGYWWSPDSQRIAFSEVDERQILPYRIMHQGKATTGPQAQEDHRYPFAGGPNAQVRLGVVGLQDGQTAWMDLGPETDLYLARVEWIDASALAAQVEDRVQTRLRLLRCDPLSGATDELLVEQNPVWINLNQLFKPLKDGRFLWGSERSGYQHLYLYEKDGESCRALTQGEWMVESLRAVDETAGLVYFSATLESPLESHLYAVSLAGGTPRRLTQAAGMHNPLVDLKSGRFLDTHDALDQPPTVRLHSLADGSELATLYTPSDPRLAALQLQPPELVSLVNRAGDLLHGALFRPPAEFGPGPYPTVVHVYGGPHAQLAVNAWKTTVMMRAQYLRSHGFLVFVLDNRGSARRGLEFESAVRWNLGDLEVQDQVDGVNWLAAQGLADPGRVGVTGWSYGGYMALMCLCRAPETFQAAVAGAPVTSWDGYDTHYTERYMGLPEANPQGYQSSAVMPFVKDLRGRLLLVHGLIDENVHFRHTARLINALIEARKPYELMLFPDERHGPRKLADRVYLEERITNFFSQSLQ